MNREDTYKHNILKKLIELPLETAAGLSLLASKRGMTTKPYMEKILIAHEKKSNKPSKNKK